VPILIGLGVHELSAVPSAVPQLKALIHKLTIEDCTRLARRALEQESAEAVRSLAMAAVPLENAPASLDD
jgi:phosphoenolpyruvate-protein kinase (PTS system EI component)